MRKKSTVIISIIIIAIFVGCIAGCSSSGKDTPVINEEPIKESDISIEEEPVKEELKQEEPAEPPVDETETEEPEASEPPADSEDETENTASATPSTEASTITTPTEEEQQPEQEAPDETVPENHPVETTPVTPPVEEPEYQEPTQKTDAEVKAIVNDYLDNYRSRVDVSGYSEKALSKLDENIEIVRNNPPLSIVYAIDDYKKGYIDVDWLFYEIENWLERGGTGDGNIYIE